MSTSSQPSPVGAEPRLIVALDLEEMDAALQVAEELVGVVETLKIGPRLFVGAGPAGVRAVRDLGFELFLDLKFHDIPATVEGACRAAASLGVRFLTVHTAGGREMLEAAMRGVRQGAAGSEPVPRVLGITVLTSLVVAGPAPVVAAAELAATAGLDGVVASAREVRALRAAVGADLLLVTPGIRPAGARSADQARVATPAAARSAGADYLVVGRPILQAADRRAAAAAIVAEMRAAAG
jgi:orotidine-5'-phosphate decarboxylase